MTPDQIPHDFLSFVLWALVIVCVTFWIAIGVAFKYMTAQLEKRDAEHKNERKQDQGEFLKSLASRDEHMASLTREVQLTNKLIIDHDTRMTAKHEIEVSTIAKQAAVVAVEKYKRENPVG